MNEKLPPYKNTISWPTPTLQGFSLAAQLSRISPQLQLVHMRLPGKLVDYLIEVCSVKGFKAESFALTLSMITRFLKQSSSVVSLQLLCLSCLMLATKLHDYHFLTLKEIHQLSNHSFTNKDIKETETLILTVLDFNLIQKSCLHEKLETAIKAVQHLLPDYTHTFYRETCLKLEILFLGTFYKNSFQSNLRKKVVQYRIVICMISGIALTLMTQCEGNFHHIIWLQELMQLQTDDVQECKEALLPLILGPQAQKHMGN